MKLLKQKGSGSIYVWTEALAQRSDMEPYERPVSKPVVEENTNENQEPVAAEPSPAPDIADALAAFRKDVPKLGRKSKKQPGEA